VRVIIAFEQVQQRMQRLSLVCRQSGRCPETIDPYRDCPEAEMRDARVSVVGAVSIGSFELSR